MFRCVLPAQGHAGMFGRLSAREHLVVTQDGHLLFSTEDLQCAHLKEGGKGGDISYLLNYES